MDTSILTKKIVFIQLFHIWWSYLKYQIMNEVVLGRSNLAKSRKYSLGFFFSVLHHPQHQTLFLNIPFIVFVVKIWFACCFSHFLDAFLSWFDLSLTWWYLTWFFIWRGVLRFTVCGTAVKCRCFSFKISYCWCISWRSCLALWQFFSTTADGGGALIVREWAGIIRVWCMFFCSKVQ